MQRHNSKASVGSMESSRGGRKKEAPTHMIIQRDGSNELFLLPALHLVNGGLTRMKLNEKATFKVDLNSRKQERGVIISFGSEDICTEQMQVLNMNVPVDQENHNPIFNNTKNHHEKGNEKRKEIDQPKSKLSSNKNQLREPNPPSINSNIPLFQNDRSRIIYSKKTMVSTNIEKDRIMGSHHSEMIPRKNLVGDKEKLSSPTDYSSDDNQSSSIATNASRSYSVMAQQSSQIPAHLKQGIVVNRKAISVSQPITQSLDDDTTSSVEIDQQDEESIDGQNKDTDQGNSLTNDMASSSYELDQTSKKYNKLLKENLSLQLEYERLKQENIQLKRTTIPMPDPNARQWFINVAKLFSNKSAEFDVIGHATSLGISDPKDLIACLQDTTSNTARQIIKFLYSPRQLLEMKGEEVPLSQRQAIRHVAEAHKGPISNHKFNEAINGVFRSKKREAVKKQNDVSKKQPITKQMNQKPIHKSLPKTTNQQPAAHLLDYNQENDL